ncbi:MAG: hypothetical protein ACREUS_14145 [Burkholderiales bacterium]
MDMVATRRAALRASMTSSWARRQRRLVAAVRARVATRGWYGLRAARVKAGRSQLASFVDRMRSEHRKGWLPAWLVDELTSIPGWPPDRSALVAERHAAGHRRALDTLARYVARRGWDGIGNDLVHRGVKALIQV